MSLKEQLLADIKEAMKAGQQQRLTVLRGVSAAIKNKEIEKGTLTENDVLDVILVEAKKRKDAIIAYEKASRPELAETEKQELVILQKYLPAQLSPTEVEAAVEKIMAQTGVKEFGPLMKQAMSGLRGKADGALVTQIIKKKLEQ